MTEPHTRASYAERAVVAEALGRHLSAGRLTWAATSVLVTVVWLVTVPQRGSRAPLAGLGDRAVGRGGAGRGDPRSRAGR